MRALGPSVPLALLGIVGCLRVLNSADVTDSIRPSATPIMVLEDRDDAPQSGANEVSSPSGSKQAGQMSSWRCPGWVDRYGLRVCCESGIQADDLLADPPD